MPGDLAVLKETIEEGGERKGAGPYKGFRIGHRMGDRGTGRGAGWTCWRGAGKGLTERRNNKYSTVLYKMRHSREA